MVSEGGEQGIAESTTRLAERGEGCVPESTTPLAERGEGAYLRARLLRRLRADRKQGGQVEQVDGQVLESVQDGGADVRALALARLPGQQQTGPVGGWRAPAAHRHEGAG